MEHTAELDTTSDFRAARNIREKRRVQASAVIPGVLLLAYGAWALLNTLNGEPPALWQVGGLLLVGMGLSLMARFLVYGRAEPGQFFVGVFITLTAAVSIGTWLVIPQFASLPLLWPVGLIVAGASILLTGLLAARRTHRLLLPGLSFVVAGAVALPFTLGMVAPGVVDLIATYWPLVFALAGLAALTSVLRRRDQPAP